MPWHKSHSGKACLPCEYACESEEHWLKKTASDILDRYVEEMLKMMMLMMTAVYGMKAIAGYRVVLMIAGVEVVGVVVTAMTS